uniref:Gag-like protein n=2 Tax=Cacopsylla melanoneura TaxID=428564 RepID=A0A8D8X4B6_9HEMI
MTGEENKVMDGGGGTIPPDKERSNDPVQPKTSDHTDPMRSNQKQVRESLHYTNDMKIEEYKLVIQKKFINNQTRIAISELQVGDVLYRKMNIGKMILEINKIGRNKIVVKCKDAETANTVVDSDALKMLGFDCFIPFSFVSRAVVIQNVDEEYTEDELQDDLECGPYKILSIKRMNRRRVVDGKLTFGPSRSIKVYFEGSEFPRHVYLWGVRLRCEPFVPPVIQCFSCSRYNHTAAQCKGKKICRVCGSKDESHTCSLKEMCINCKGEHKADDKECPEKKRQKAIKYIMAYQNLTFMEAAIQMPKLDERSLFSVVTKNMYDVLDGYEEEFPELGNRRVSAKPKLQEVFEPYRAPAAVRRKVETSKRQYLQARSKRNRSEDNTPEEQYHAEKKTNVNRSVFTSSSNGSTTPRKSQYNRVHGYEFFRQDRNYTKYENLGKFKSQQQEKQNKDSGKSNEISENSSDVNTNNLDRESNKISEVNDETMEIELK